MPTLKSYQFSIRFLICMSVLPSLLLATIRNATERHDQVVNGLERKGFIVLDAPRFSAYTPKWIQNWSPKEVVYVDGICDSVDDIGLINACHSLSYLNLTGSTIDRHAISNLGKFPKCTTLVLSETQITDQELRRIAELMPNLESLSIDGLDVTEDGLAILAAFPRLAKLSLDGDLLTETGVRKLRELPSLSYVHVVSKSVDEETAARIIEHLPIETLSFSFGCEVSEAATDRAVEWGVDIRFDCGTYWYLEKVSIPRESAVSP